MNCPFNFYIICRPCYRWGWQCFRSSQSDFSYFYISTPFWYGVLTFVWFIILMYFRRLPISLMDSVLSWINAYALFHLTFFFGGIYFCLEVVIPSLALEKKWSLSELIPLKFLKSVTWLSCLASMLDLFDVCLFVNVAVFEHTWFNNHIVFWRKIDKS